MGTRAEPADPTRLQAAIAEVRSDAADIYRKSWVIVGHVENNPLVIDVLSYVSLSSAHITVHFHDIVHMAVSAFDLCL